MKAMKQQFRRICSILLAAILIVTSVPGMETTAFAAQDGVEDEAVSVSDGDIGVSDGDEGVPGYDEGEDAPVSGDNEGVSDGDEGVPGYDEGEDAPVSGDDEGVSDGDDPEYDEGVDEGEDDTGNVTPKYFMNFAFTVNGTKEEQSAVMEQVRVQSVDGSYDYGMSIPLNGEAIISFHIEIPEGYTITSIKTAYSPKLYRITKDYENNNFTITDYMYGAFGREDVPVNVYIDKIQDKELYIEYPDTIESVEVLNGDTPVEIINNIATVSNAKNVTINVKPQANQLVTATYESENDSEPMIYQESYIEEDGTYCYEIGRVVCNTSMLFTTAPGAKLNIDLGNEINGYIYGYEEDISLSDGLVITKKIGNRFNFYLDFDEVLIYDNDLVITNTLSDGTEEQLELVFDEDNWEYYCAYEVTEDATISFEWVPKTACEVKLNLENVTAYNVYDYGDGDYDISGEWQDRTVYEGELVLFAIKIPMNHELQYVSTTDSEENALSFVNKIVYEEGDVYYIYKYAPTEDTIIYAKALENTKYEVVLNLKGVTAYNVYDYGYGEYEIDNEWEDKTVYEGKSVMFAIRISMYDKLQYVSLSDSEENALSNIATVDYGEGEIYYIYKYIPIADTTIYAKATAKTVYDVSLNLENVKAYTVYDYGYGEYEIDNEWEDKTVYEGESVVFAIQMPMDYKLEYVSPTDSEENALSRIATYDDGDLYYIYQYTPTADTVIYAKAVEKEKYTLTFDIDSPYVYVYGYDFESVDGTNEYELYEGYHSFIVKTEENLKIESVIGTGDVSENDIGELERRYDIEMQDYYYVIPLTSNMTVTVTSAERKQYEVKIDTENVTIANVTGYTDNTDNVYTVYENDTISFNVLPNDGFRIDSVRAAGQTLYPVINSNVYTYAVKVAGDMDIDIMTTEKTACTITFETTNATVFSSYPADEEGKCLAYVNEAFYFTVEADEGYAIEEVVCNDEKLQPIYNPQNSTIYYEIVPKGDTTISVIANASEDKQIKFVYDGYDANTISVWAEGGQTYIPSEDSVTVPSSKAIWFDVNELPHTIAKVLYTDALGETKTIYRTSHNGNEGYYIGNVTDDVQINIVSGDTYAVTLRDYGDVVFMPIDGVGTFADIVYVPTGESFNFKAVAREGYTLQTVELSGSASITGSLKTGEYQIIPDSNFYSSIYVTVMSARIRNIEWAFDYAEEDVSVDVYIGEEQIPLVDKKITFPSTETVILKIKPLVDKLMRFNVELEPTSVEEDGTQVYVIENVTDYEDMPIFIYMYEYNTVNFQIDNASLMVGSYSYDDNWTWEGSDTVLKLSKGSTINFRVNVDSGYYVSDVTLADETTGTISKKSYYDYYYEVTYEYYTLTTKEDAIVNVTTKEIPYYTYNFEYDSSKVDLYMGYYSNYYDPWDYEIEWEEGTTEYKKYQSNSQNVMFRVVPKEGYRILSVTSNRKDSNIPSDYVEVYDEENDYYYSVPYYYLTNTEDTTITIEAEEIQYYTYNFEYDSSKVDVYRGYYSYYYDEWDYGLEWVEGVTEYKQTDYDSDDILFRVVPKEGYKITSIMSDREDSYIPNINDDGMQYYRLENTEDTTVTIVAEKIQFYEFSFEFGAGIDSVSVVDFSEGNDYSIYSSDETVTLSNNNRYYVVPWLYYNGDDTVSYRVVSVKANGVELAGSYNEDYGYGYYVPSNFNEDVTIAIETEMNEAVFNTTTLAVNGNKNSYKVFRYVETETEDGDYITSKVYVNNKLYTSGKTDSFGIEPAEGYTILKVEFTRNGKVQTLTPDEEGFYSISYPLSRGLQGTLTVYTFNENGDVSDNEGGDVSDNEGGDVSDNEGGDVSDNEGGDVSDNEGGDVSDNEGGDISDNEGGDVSDNEGGDVSDNEGGDVSDNEGGDVSDNEGGDVSDNEGGDVSDNEGGDVSDNEDDNEEDKPVVIESVVIAGITDGKVSLAIDAIKDYKFSVNPTDIDLSRIGVEVITAEGQPADVVKAEIAEGKLRITTAAVVAGENVATVKLYDKTAKEKTYIPGGTFTVSTLSPAALVNSNVQIELKRIYDVAFTLGVAAPEGLNELIHGKYYYKVVVTPQGENVPEEIKKATEKPQYFEKTSEDYQDIRVFVNTNDFGGGQAWTYDIRVFLVQTNGAGVPDGTTDTQILYESKKAGLSDISTLNPYFTEKVTFKKLEKQIYTAQNKVAVAQIALDEGTSYPDIDKVEDVTELNGKGSALEVWEEDSYIFVNVPSDAMTGKHTIEVTVGGPASMNKTTGTFEINVIKGIENMQVSVPTVSVYKQANKAVTIKATVTYNQDMAAPKSKKAVWEVVKPNGEAFTQGDALYGMLTVKNGKVTVNKTFIPSEKESDNQFRVQATAADYEANTVYALSDVITLTSKPAEIGAVYVVAPTEGGYQVVVKEGSTITTDKLENAFVAVLKKDAAEKDFYTEEELNNLMLSSEILTYKSSNKAVAVQKADAVTLSATKAAKNVKLTVTTNDGGKKKAVMTFTVAYATPEALALEVLNGNQALGEAGTKEVSFAGTTNTRLLVKVKEKSGETWTDLKALSNYKLSVKNGKIVASDNVNGIYEVIVTAKTATVTLDNKTTGATAKDAYQITNTAYSEAKAPKVKTKSKLIAGVMADRSVTYSLSGSYSYKNKYVLVETDYIDRSKKAEIYSQFESAATNLNTLIPIKSDGTFTLTFNENQIPVGSYKLKLTFGTGSDVNTFIADAKPATVTLKAAKPKVTKGSYKPTTSYKMEAKAGTTVALTGKGKNLVDNSLVYYDLKNANIKGKQNGFLSYFELKDNTLCLKKGLTDEDITYLKSKDGKNDLTGYVTYTVSYGDDGYGNPYTVTKTVKLTIKLK